MFVVGNVGLAELAPKLKEAEKSLLREVNPVTCSMSEFKKKIRNKDHFLSTVIDGDKLFLQGQDEYVDAVSK